MTGEGGQTLIDLPTAFLAEMELSPAAREAFARRESTSTTHPPGSQRPGAGSGSAESRRRSAAGPDRGSKSGARRGSAPAADLDRPRLSRNFAALFSGQLLTWAMTLLWTLVVPRVLGPASFGIITAALSVSGVLFIFLGLGTRNYLVREMVLRPEEGPKLVGTAIVLRLMLAPAVAIGAVVFAWAAHYGHEQTIALFLAALMNVALLIDDSVAAAFQAIERMKYLAIGDAINKSAQSLIGIAVALAGLGAIGITANVAVTASVVVGLHLVWLRRYMRIDLRTDLAAVYRMARGSLNYWAGGLFFTFYLWIDTVLLSLITDTKVVGWYGASTTLVMTLMFLPILMSTAWYPRFVDAYKHSRQRLFETARIPTEFLLVVSAPLAAVTALSASVVVRSLYGAAYDPAAPVMVILALGIPPTYYNIFVGQALVAEGRQAVRTWTLVGAAIVNPALNLVLIPATEHLYRNGAIGAALALGLTELLMCVPTFVIAGRHIWDIHLSKRLGLAVGVSAAMCGVTTAAAPLGVWIALPAGVALLLILTFAMRIPTDEEMAFLRAGVAWLRSRTVRPG